MSVPDIAAAAEKAVVSIETLDRARNVMTSGSGWIVEPTGTIVSNYHVIAGGRGLRVTLSSGLSFNRVYVIAIDRARDLVLLGVDGRELPVLPVGTDDAVRVGDRVYVMGNPMGLDRTFSDGLISSRRLIRGNQLLQITAPISHGSSGGPVMNGFGEVVGVAVSQLTEGQNLNLAIPSRYVRYLLDGSRKAILYGDNVAPSDRSISPSGSPQSAPKGVADQWEAGARRQLLNWIAQGTGDYRQSHEVVTGILNEGQSEAVEFSLLHGNTYVALGTCDADCIDLDLGVVDPDNVLVGNDFKDDDHPLAVVTAKRSGAYNVKVLMSKCSVEPCRYAISMLVKRTKPNTTPAGAPRKQNSLQIDKVELGNSLNADKTVAARRQNFGIRDTIYVSVRTVGSGSATLTANFTYGDGQQVSRSSMDVDAAGRAIHEFHIAKRSPWPTGSYRVELFLDGVRLATELFTIN